MPYLVGNRQDDVKLLPPPPKYAHTAGPSRAKTTSRFIMRQGRGGEATEADFCLSGYNASSYRGPYMVPLFN